MTNLRELLVGRRGEAPLVPPYILCNFKLDGAVEILASFRVYVWTSKLTGHSR